MIDPLYDDGHVTLYHADCLDVLGDIQTRHGRPVHVITDPPYSPRVAAGARSSRGLRATNGTDGEFTEGGSPAPFVPFDLDVETIRLALALAGPSRWSIVFCDHVDAAFLQIAPPLGLRHIRWGCWVKPDCAPQFNGKCPANGFESIAILHSEEPTMRWNCGGKRGVWTHNVCRDVPWHPTPKPVSLLVELLEDFTDVGDLIVDPFAGSGRLALACRATQRRCVLVEKSEAYAKQTADALARFPVDDGNRTPSLFVAA